MTVLNGWVSMPKVFLVNSGLTAENQTNATITIEAVTHSRLNQGIKAKLALFQTEEGDYTPKNTLCQFTLVDSATDDVVVQIEGNLGDDEDDYGTLIAAAPKSVYLPNNVHLLKRQPDYPEVVKLLLNAKNH